MELLDGNVLKHGLTGLIWLVSFIGLVWSGLYGLFIGLFSIFLFFSISFLNFI